MIKPFEVTLDIHHIFLYNYWYINCIFVIRHPDDGHKSDRNIFGKNNNGCLCVPVCPCHHCMARPQVADGGTASDMEGSCECIE